jgi:hypothetical protein
MAAIVQSRMRASELRVLMSDFQMGFGAADFKTDASIGALVFLELNTSPMFARFDSQCDGALWRAPPPHYTLLPDILLPR